MLKNYSREEQNLYKKQLAAAKPNKSTLTIQLQINSNKSTLTTQLRLNFDIPPIFPRSNGTFFVKNITRVPLKINKSDDF